jgi:hypothetical protein
MSVSGISSSSVFNTRSANVQNQQQWQQEFQKLTQELQSGSLASPGANVQTTGRAQIAATQSGPQSIAAPTAQNSDPGSLLLNAPHGTPKHSLHLRHPHHLQVGAGNDSEEGSNPSPEIANPGNASSAQQAFTSWQQNFQQVALNSDLLTAQSADWQPVSLSA